MDIANHKIENSVESCLKCFRSTYKLIGFSPLIITLLLSVEIVGSRVGLIYLRLRWISQDRFRIWNRSQTRESRYTAMGLSNLNV